MPMHSTNSSLYGMNSGVDKTIVALLCYSVNADALSMIDIYVQCLSCEVW